MSSSAQTPAELDSFAFSRFPVPGDGFFSTRALEFERVFKLVWVDCATTSPEPVFIL